MNNILLSLINKIKGFSKEKLILLIFSLIIAIFSWFIISITIYPTTVKTLTDVKVETIDLTGTNAEAKNLKIVSSDLPKTVDVRIEGKRVEIGSLSSDELTAKIIVTGDIIKAGTYTLDIQIKSKDNASFTTLGVTPETVDVEFDEISSKEFLITSDKIKTPNLSAADGFVFFESERKCEPSTVQVTGPKTQIDQITDIFIQSEIKQELNAPYNTSTTDIVVCKDNGTTVMDKSKFTFDNENFNIDIPVYMRKELGINIKFANVPDYFDINSLKYELSANTITLASPDNSIESYETVDIVQPIDLCYIEPGASFECDIAIPDGWKNLSGNANETGAKVTVTFKLDNYKKVKLGKIAEFNLINVPAQYDVTVVSSYIEPEFIIPKNILNSGTAISTLDVVAQVNLSKVTVNGGSFTAPVTILNPKYKNIWAINLPYITLEAKLKTKPS